MKNKWRIFILLFIFSLSSQLTFSYDFTGKKVDLTSVVTKGTLLKCDTLNAQIIHKNTMPKTFAWAEKSGLIEVHGVTGSNQFSDKVTTKRSYNRRTLCIGCWIAKKVFKETTNGKDRYFAVGVYHLNDLILDSPLVKSPVCKSKKKDEIFKESDYSIYYEYFREYNCTGNLIDSLALMDGEEALFELKRSSYMNGHIVNINR